MNEYLDAESITRNKSYSAVDHLEHLLKIGWAPESQLIKKFLKDNNISEEILTSTIRKLNASQS